MLRELPRKGIVFATYLINAAIRLKYVPFPWRKAKMIAILKPGKSPEDPALYRPISLLSVISKIFKKAILNRMKAVITEKDLLPSVQFGFWEKHSTLEQIHRVVDTITQALENREYAPAVFLNVSTAFDRVWHHGLLHKLQTSFTPSLCTLLRSYLRNRVFSVHIGSASSPPTRIAAGVPQGSVLGPTLFLLYTRDFPTMDSTTTALFADDSAVIAHGNDYENSTAICAQVCLEVNMPVPESPVSVFLVFFAARGSRFVALCRQRVVGRVALC
jgi:hypothetical protein